jgi:hypothetical protein
LEDDELPLYQQKRKGLDISQIDFKKKMNDMEGLMAMQKKGQAIMIFVTISDKPSQKEYKELTELWQTSLRNAGFQATL